MTVATPTTSVEMNENVPCMDPDERGRRMLVFVSILVAVIALRGMVVVGCKLARHYGLVADDDYPYQDG